MAAEITWRATQMDTAIALVVDTTNRERHHALPLLSQKPLPMGQRYHEVPK